MRKSYFIIPLALVSLLLADHFHFSELRANSDGGAVSEAFLRKGTLGKLLRDNGLIKISPDTAKLATNDMCAVDSEIKGYDYHNTYRMRFKMLSASAELMHVKIFFPKAKRYKEVQEAFYVVPGQHYYSVNFVAHKDREFQLTFTSTPQTNIILSDIAIDGRFGRTQMLLENGEAVNGKFDQAVTVHTSEADKGFTGVQFVQSSPKIHYSVPGGLDNSLYSGVFPGKKNQGFCRYTAQSARAVPAAPNGTLIPNVNLNVDDEYLYGEKGIINNKQGKGKAWEVPAQYSVNNGETTDQQQVGLRFHGGTPGRKKDILSFRINARLGYGKSAIATVPLLGQARDIGMKGVVFKYTYQAYGLERTIYNPYNHALALDIANAVGALVPAHGLVNLSINDEKQGLFLAMEHLSERTIRNWLGQKEFVTYAYKKHNSEHQQHSLFYPIGKILKTQGEEALKLLLESYDINNVLNSIILSAYISDDDYCQGIEIIEKNRETNQNFITSVNWDLDHAFLAYKNGQYSMPASRKGMGAGFNILIKNKRQSDSLCPRKWAYSHVYAESEEFRNLVRQRLESILSNELSPARVNLLIEKYRNIDNHYYQGKHEPIIDQLIAYAEKRPSVLLTELSKVEQLVQKQNVTLKKSGI